MKNLFKKYLSIVAITASTFSLTGNTAVAGECTSATMINSLPVSISSPGTYCLASNLSFTSSGTGSSYAISIFTSDVILNLNGKTVSGRWASNTPTTTPGVENAINVSVWNSGYPEDVVIKNGTLSGFRVGIVNQTNTGSNNVKRLTIKNLTITNMVNAGIGFAGNSRCDDCTISNNVITNINPNLCTNCGSWASGYGISAEDSDNLDINDNFIYNVAAAGSALSYGIYLRYSHNALIDNNTVSNLPSSSYHTGIFGIGASNMTVQNNSINRFYRGIWYRYSNGVYSGTSHTNVTIPYTGGTDGGGNQ